MNEIPRSPFDSIEDARDFLILLTQTVFETKLEIETDVERESGSNFPRRADALRLAVYSLSRLEFHMQRSQRILNDLRTLRRLLFEERTLTALTQRPQTNGKARAETLMPTASRPLQQMNARVGAA
jgi:hypothetical protein